jgi:micrococcal nuclease
MSQPAHAAHSHLRVTAKWTFEGNPLSMQRFDFKKIVIQVQLLHLWVLLFPAGALGLDAFWVKYVVDGDTVILENGRSVRYIGIDAPEIYHKENRAQVFGYTARDYNRRMIADGRIYLSYDREKKDAYNRLLAYVFDKDKNFLNQLLLLQGYAHCLYIPPNTRQHEVLLKAQRTAMTEKRGLWGQWTAAQQTYVGNTRTKRFHLPGCPHGQRIGKNNRIHFKGLWEAYWEGYAPCRQCLSVSPLSR